MEEETGIGKAKDDFSFFNEGDYITREMAESKDVILNYIKQIETENFALQKVHKYDVAMIDTLKGKSVELYNIIDELEAESEILKGEIDYYKARYLEFNDAFIKRRLKVNEGVSLCTTMQTTGL